MKQEALHITSILGPLPYLDSGFTITRSALHISNSHQYTHSLVPNSLRVRSTVAQAKAFRDEEVYIACRVKVPDMADLPAFAQYPDKIRAKGGYALYQVDADGNRIKINKRDSKGRFIKSNKEVSDATDISSTDRGSGSTVLR